MIRSHNTDYTINFYNDRVKEIIAPEIVAEPFTFIPIAAGHMELLSGEEGDAIVFGKIKEGYSVFDINIVPNLTYENIANIEAIAQLAVEKIIIDENNYVNPYGPACFEYRGIDCVIAITLPDRIYEGNAYFVNVRGPAESTYTATYTANPGDTITDVKNGLQVSMAANGFEVLAGAPVNQIYIFNRYAYFCSDPYQAGGAEDVLFEYDVDAYISAVGFTTCFNNLKCGATHGYGIVYKDNAGRCCSVIKTSLMNVTIPFYTEDDGPDINQRPALNFGIYHKPPDWADTFEIVYFGNISMNNYFQIRLDQIINLTPLGIIDFFGADLQTTLDATRERNTRWKVPNYEWQEGDRIRLMGYIVEDGVDAGDFVKYDELYDYEITQTGTEEGEAIGGDFLYFQAINHPHPFGNETEIENLTIDLNGTIEYTTPSGPAVARVDKITLTGTGGTAEITCGGLVRVATYHLNLNTTASDFKTAYEADFLAVGIIVTTVGPAIVFTAQVAGVDFSGPHNIIAEVYKPCKGLSITTPYGCGMVFNIGVDTNGHRYHKGDVDQIINEDGAVASPAEVLNTASDGYKFVRLNYLYEETTIYPFWAESVWPSDWWTWIISNKLDVGFPFLFDLNQNQAILDERMRNGGFIITGSRTNNLAHFVYNDYLDLAKKDGPITGLRQVGYTLKALQLYKETSIYINRIVNFNADGTENFTLTNAFLGTIYPLSTDFGCQHPNSIMVNGRNIYYWDQSHGAFIRSAPNGQIDLASAKYKVSRWFTDLVAWIRGNGGSDLVEINTGANNEHEEVWLTFRIGGSVHGMIFSEKDGRFKSRINQPTEAYVHLGDFFAHMYRQRLWIMNLKAGQDYLTWVGEPVYAKIKIASNIEQEKNKIFKAVALYSDHKWISEDKTIIIPEVASAVNEKMETNIAVWDRREGIFYGKILKDANSRGNFVSDNHKKMNGRSMRGRYCYFEFKIEEHSEKVRLDKIIVFSTESERSP